METGITTRKVTRQFRLQQWQAIFHDRAESGLSVKDYCQNHGITKDSYYYWQKVAREAAITDNGAVFAELRPEAAGSAAGFVPEITVRIGNAVLAANSTTPEELLLRTVRILKYAE
jgi:transposase-like protein